MMLQAAASNKGLRAIVSEGAGFRSVREDVQRGPRGWFALPEAAVQTAAIAVMSGTAPPPPLKDLVPRIAPRQVFFIYAGHGAGGEEYNPDLYQPPEPLEPSGRSPRLDMSADSTHAPESTSSASSASSTAHSSDRSKTELPAPTHTPRSVLRRLVGAPRVARAEIPRPVEVVVIEMPFLTRPDQLAAASRPPTPDDHGAAVAPPPPPLTRPLGSAQSRRHSIHSRDHLIGSSLNPGGPIDKARRGGRTHRRPDERFPGNRRAAHDATRPARPSVIAAAFLRFRIADK